jgi:hypothetical protein
MPVAGTLVPAGGPLRRPILDLLMVAERIVNHDPSIPNHKSTDHIGYWRGPLPAPADDASNPAIK